MFATTICLLLSIAIVACDNANAVARAKQWVDAQVPYCQAPNGGRDHDSACASTCSRPHVAEWDAYRSDCSGLVSWAWGLPPPGRITSDFGSVSSTIQGSDLQSGDALVRSGVHIILFVSWNVQGSSATFYEEPGCSGSVNYAHEFTASVSISGSSVTVRGATYKAIRYSGSTPGAGPSSSSGLFGGGSSSMMMAAASSMSGGLFSGLIGGSSSNNMNFKSSGMMAAASSGASGGLFSGLSGLFGGNANSMMMGAASTTSGGLFAGLFGGSSANSSMQAASSGTGGGLFAGLFGGNANSAMMMAAASSGGGGLFSNLFGGGNANSAMMMQSSSMSSGMGGNGANSNGGNSNLFVAVAGSDSNAQNDVAWAGASVAGNSAYSYFDVISAPATPASTPSWKTYGKCTSVSGVCQEIKNPCALSYISFQCAGVSVPNVRCCPSKQTADIGLDGEKWRLIPGPLPSAACKNLHFPLAPGSLQHISVNFGGKRNNGAQCHAGIDLFTHNDKKVVAMADGIVTNVISNVVTCKCTGKPMQAGAVLVYHPSIGQTVNYAEMSTSSIAVKKGAVVTHGQFLGTADACCLLHIELYNGTQSELLRWLPASGKTSYDPDGCTHNSMHVKPAGLLDPRPLINCLKPPGASLLQDAGVGGEQLAAAPFKMAMISANVMAMMFPKSVIAAIVIVGVLVLTAIIVCIVCLLRRQRSSESLGELSVKNPAFDANAAAEMTIGEMPQATTLRAGTVSTAHADEPVGDFACTVCGSKYQYASDLEQHRQLRHA